MERASIPVDEHIPVAFRTESQLLPNLGGIVGSIIGLRGLLGIGHRGPKQLLEGATGRGLNGESTIDRHSILSGVGSEAEGIFRFIGFAVGVEVHSGRYAGIDGGGELIVVTNGRLLGGEALNLVEVLRAKERDGLGIGIEVDLVDEQNIWLNGLDDAGKAFGLLGVTLEILEKFAGSGTVEGDVIGRDTKRTFGGSRGQPFGIVVGLRRGKHERGDQCGEKETLHSR